MTRPILDPILNFADAAREARKGHGIGDFQLVTPECETTTRHLLESQAQQAVAAEREKWAKKLAEVGRLGFITGYVRAEGERYYRDTGFTLFPAERDAFEARAEDTFRVLEELPPEVRPPLFAALATTEEG